MSTLSTTTTQTHVSLSTKYVDLNLSPKNKEKKVIYTNSYFKSLARSLTSYTDDTLILSVTIASSVVYFFLLIFFTDVYLIPKYHSTTMTDYIILNLYLASAFQVTFLNSLYHVFKAHSLSKSIKWSNINQFGTINYLISSTISLLYYGFYDNVFYFKLLTVLTFILNIIMVIVINLKETDRTHYFGSSRLTFITFITVLILLPLSLAYWKFGPEKIKTKIDLNMLTFEIGCYIISGILYTYKVPKLMGISESRAINMFYLILVFASFLHFKVLLNSFVMMRIGIKKPTLINFND